MNIKYIHHIRPHSTFPYVHPLPEKTCFIPYPFSFFFKDYIDNPKEFHLGISDRCILCFTQITAPLLYHHASLLFSSLQNYVIWYSYVNGMFGCVSFSNSCFPLSSPVVIISVIYQVQLQKLISFSL
jgi:hypothetical protein